MKPKADITPLIEWAIWANLDKQKDLELILLKGHQLLEIIMDLVLDRKNKKNCHNYSFYYKVKCLEKIKFKNEIKKEIIISSLLSINRLRNKVAHEYTYKLENGEFQLWSARILRNLKGTKFSRFTDRTKLVHSFSMLALNLIEMTSTNITTP